MQQLVFSLYTWSYAVMLLGKVNHSIVVGKLDYNPPIFEGYL